MSSPFKRIAFRFAVNYGISIVSVAVTTGALWVLRFHLHKAHFGLIYLLVVAAAAASGGTRAALLAAVLSFLSWNYFFLPPFYTFVVADPLDWMLLLVFLVIGVLIGQMTGRMREREDESVAREKDTAALYKAILAVSTQTSLDPLVEQVVLSTGARGCAVLLVSAQDGGLVRSVHCGDISALEQDERQRIVRWVTENGKAVGLEPMPVFSAQEETPWPVSVTHKDVLPDAGNFFEVYLPLCTAERTFGVMVAFPKTVEIFSLSDCRLLVAFASNASTFLERRRLLEEAAQAAAMHETEKLKSILFSSLSHNLKTPLASLTATLSSLQQGDVEWDKNTLQEHFAFMAEDVGRLTEYIENLLSLAELESENWEPRREWAELQDIVSTALRRLPENEYRRIGVDIPENFPLIYVDYVQMSQVLRHLVENALNYSPETTKVKIGAKKQKEQVEFWVDDEGRGIPASERKQVFRKFYRGDAAIKYGVGGTGLGLAICSEIVQSHQGTICVEDSPSGGARLRVMLAVKQLVSEIKDDER